jgi:hypothetical protein
VARSVLYNTSFRIAKDFFPFGSGLGTFGGWISALYYSPLYTQYNISNVYGLEKGGKFLMDTFWPYLIAQFGIFGAILYCLILVSLLIGMINIYKKSDDLFMKSFALGSSLILMEAVFESIAVPIFLRPPEYYFIFMSLGIARSLSRNTDRIG